MGDDRFAKIPKQTQRPSGPCSACSTTGYERVTMKSKVKLSAVILSFILIGSVEPVFAQANFYEGKTIRFIVGFPAGGGYATYPRLIARHMGKYVPGNPVFVVDNMA